MKELSSFGSNTKESKGNWRLEKDVSYSTGIPHLVIGDLYIN